MVRIKCNNSERKSVQFTLNGGRKDEIMVFALQDGEYWFAVGNGRMYKTASGAKKAAMKETCSKLLKRFECFIDYEE